MNKLLICNCEDSTGNTTVRCCNLCGLSVDHVWKPQLTFEKFTLLKETPTVATDNTLPTSSPTATAEEKHFLLGKEIRYRYVDWEEGSFTPWYTCNQSDLKKILEDHSVEIVEFKP